MKYLLCGILGIILGFLVFYLLFRIASRFSGSPFYLLCGSVYRYQGNTYRLLTIRRIGNVYSHADNYSNCLVLLESQGRKHYQNQTGIPGGNKGYTR